MSLGFIDIPFPFIIFLFVIIFNVVAAINKKKKESEQATSIKNEKKKDLGLIAYDLLMKKKREEDRDCFTEEFVEEELNANLEPVMAEVIEPVAPRQPVKHNKKLHFGLTQLQQAVVMKEILDKPKSLQRGH